MRRSRWIGWGSSSAIGLFLAFVLGCTTVTWPPWTTAPPRTFWDLFEPGEAGGRYNSVMEPRLRAGSGTNVRVLAGKPVTKHFDFGGVQQDERAMAEALERIQADMLERVRVSGGEIRGEVRVTRERGLLRQFEFEYRHHGIKGLVQGSIQPSDDRTGWDLQCVVGEESRRR